MREASVTTQASTYNTGAVRRVRSQAASTSTIDSAEIAEMDLVTLERHCATESERFYRGQPHDTRFAYELFRRALVERDEVAWENILIHQPPRVTRWLCPRVL